MHIFLNVLSIFRDEAALFKLERMKQEANMTVRISKKVKDYFKSETSLVVAVNSIAQYMNLSELKGFEVSNSAVETALVEVDESELCDDLLKDERLFALVAVYAMGIGE